MEKTNNLLTASTRAETILLTYPTSLLVFERLGLPLHVCDKELVDLAQESGFRVQLLINLLQLTLGYPLEVLSPFQIEDTPYIINYLLAGHEYYMYEANPNIAAMLGKILPDTEDTNRDLLRKFFDQYMSEVCVHFNYERDVVFPYIRSFFETRTPRTFRVREYKHRHSDIQAKLEDLQHLILCYLPPLRDKSLARRLLYSLGVLCTDLSIHTMLEDKVVVPLVEHLETQWNN